MNQLMKFSLYHFFLKHCHVNSSFAYFESHASTDFAGNMLRIAETLLSGKYGRFKLFISVKSLLEIPTNITRLMNQYPNAKIELVLRASIRNCYIYSICKYLFTDVDFLPFYQKRNGQVVVQTWHGTPLKKLGFDYINDVTITGNQQRAFAIADFCLFPNQLTMENIIESYRLENIMQGKILQDGYPRNCVFFNKNGSKKLREKLGLTKKQIYVYMPTWRGSISGGCQEPQLQQLQLYLTELDKSLKDNQILFAKLHRLNRATINFNEFSHIYPFPDTYETYEFLAISDCLITDYSSVMFDFLNTRKKIILFVYDRQEYLQQQGTYIDLSELPFPQVENIAALVKELNKPKTYDDTTVYKKFCPYDDYMATFRLCDKIINGEPVSIELSPPNNGKENVLLFGGSLNPNNTTLNFINYLDSLDTNQKNYYVAFINQSFRTNPIRLQSISRPFGLLSIDLYNGAAIFPTICEYIALKQFKKQKWMWSFCKKKVEKLFCREFNRQFLGLNLSAVIRFGGLDVESLSLFEFSPVENKVILVYPEMYSSKNEDLKLYLGLANMCGCTLVSIVDNNLYQSVYKIDNSSKDIV